LKTSTTEILLIVRKAMVVTKLSRGGTNWSLINQRESRDEIVRVLAGCADVNWEMGVELIM
jgi:hypothetical protein